MRVAILGPLAVEHDGRPVPIGGQRLRALFARLVLETGRWISASALVDALWEGGADPTAPADPQNALQSLVSRLRRLLPEPGLLVSSASGYRLVLDPADLDATRFERLAATGRAALARDDDEGAARALDEAHALWRGPALADLDGSAFTQPYATHLEQLRRAADQDRFEAAIRLGRHGDVVQQLETLVAADPLDERASALLIRALAAAGRQADALTAYDRTRTHLVDQLGLDPSPELAAAHQSVLAGPPPAPRRPAARGNLPTALTSFVGRDAELARIEQLLATHRLVTLTGPGGAGKTRLAVAAGLRAGDAPYGVWLVELAPVSDPDEVPAAVLGALSAREMNLIEPRQSGDRDVMNRLVDQLAGRSALLVLDNCEHLVDAAARVADRLLAACPDLRILATSREPLAIFGEAICPVLPLGLPRPGMSAGDAVAYASVRLFADRAAIVLPGFTVDDATVGSVIEICRRLDGLPLAIELAAARLRTLPLDVVAERLESRFRLLTGGSRTAAARHQTLRAVVAWSWELLTPDERALAEALAVYSGGISSESATAVSGTDADETLELLAALADKSILQPVPGAQLRWRMLETLREFGVERLTEQQRSDAVRLAHAAYFCALAEHHEPFLRGPRQLTSLRLLILERDNLGTGLRYSVDRGDTALAVRFGAALVWFWQLLGAEAEALAWCSQVIQMPDAEKAPGFLLCVIGWTFGTFGSLAERGETGRKVSALAEQLSADAVVSGHPLLVMLEPGLALASGDMERGMRAIADRLDHPDPWARAAMLLFRSLVAENSGDIATQRLSLGQALSSFRELEDRWGIAMSLAISAGLKVLDDELPAAVAEYEEATELLGELGSADDNVYLLMRAAIAYERMGDQANAARKLAQARDVSERDGSASTLVMTEFAIGQQYLRSDDRPAGLAFVREAVGRAERTPRVAPQALASMYITLADLEGHPPDDVAFGHLARGWELATKSFDMPVVALAGVKLAELTCRGGDPALAVRLLGAADSIRGTPDRSDRDVAAVLAEARSALGDRVDDELAAGRGLSRDEALALLAGQLPPAESVLPAR